MSASSVVFVGFPQEIDHGEHRGAQSTITEDPLCFSVSSVVYFSARKQSRSKKQLGRRFALIEFPRFHAF
jgi:hypothetical protein